MEYEVNGRRLSYLSDGPTAWGDDVVLLDHAEDLTANTPWTSAGYGIDRLFDNESTFQIFLKSARELIISRWISAGLIVPKNVDLTLYHTMISDASQHLAAVNKTKLIGVGDFPLGIRKIEDRISEICQIPLVAQNPFDNERVFHFRVVRPLQWDNNPLHRDVWLEDYDNCINLYIPLAGSNAKSSLILFEGSHHWSEKRVKRTITGATINNVKFNVPAVAEIEGLFNAVRPDPKPDEVLVFSPYLIHGGSANLNADETRISIELRLWKKG